MAFELVPTDEPDIRAELREDAPRTINAIKLDNDLRAGFGNMVAGVTQRKGCVTVLLAQTPDDMVRNAIQTIVIAHNAAELTPEQQSERDDTADALAAKTQMAAARQALTTDWDASSPGVKLEAVRLGVLVCMRLLKLIIRKYL